METIMFKAIVVHIFLLALLCPALSQAQNHKFEHISVANGLSHSVVLCAFQDSQGFLWFCTQDGLNKYDGYDFTIYRRDNDDPYSISSNFARDVIEDAEGYLWITTDYGLNQFDPKTERFTHYFHNPEQANSLSEDDLQSIFIDSRQDLWVTTTGSGIVRFNPSTQLFTHYQAQETAEDSLSGNEFSGANTIYEDSQGFLWFATAGSGLNRFNPQTQQFSHYSQYAETADYKLVNDTVYAVREDAQQQLWIATEGGLVQLDLISGKITFHLQEIIIYDVTFAEDGTLWLACGSSGYALTRYDPQTTIAKSFVVDSSDPYRLSNDYPRALLLDDQDNLWIPTWGGGINKLSKLYKFEHFYFISGKDKGLTDNTIYNFYEDAEGFVWIATEGGGVCRFNPEELNFNCYQNEPNNENSLLSDDTYTVVGDGKGILWIATWEGVSRFDTKTGKFTSFVPDPADANSLNSSSVTSIALDSHGDVWISTLGSGINRYNPEKQQFTHYKHNPLNNNSLANDAIYWMTFDHAGMLWLATEKGLDRFDPSTEEFTHYQYDPNSLNSISGNNITYIYEDKQQRLWVGTSGDGLNLFQPETNTFQQFSQESIGLASNTINGIMQDQQDYLWITTTRGLTRLQPDTLSVRNYTVEDGLQNNEFFFGAVLATRTGELYAGGANGFNRFTPELLQDNTHKPNVVFTDLKLFNKSVKISKNSILPEHINYVDKLTFSHLDNVFSIHFAALDFVKPNKNQYAYQLVGFDKDWVTVNSRQRFAIYTNLPAGQYQFRVKASNNDGVWNEQGASLQIEILPPWWNTTWAYTLYILIFAWFFIDQQRKLQKSRAYNQKLREIDKLKEQSVQTAQANEQRLRQFLDAIPLGIAVLNSDGSLHYMNPTAMNVLGLHTVVESEDAVYDLPNLSSFYHFYQAGTNTLYPNEELTSVAALRGESKIIDDIEVHRPDKTIVPIETRGMPIFNQQQQVKYVIVTFQDIRERKQAESDRLRLVQEQEAKNVALRYNQEIEMKNQALIHLNQEKNEFLGIAAHDLKNPLAAIRGLAEYIQESISTLTEAEIVENAELIEAASRQMFDLITNLLDVNAIESGNINMQLSRTNLIPIVDSLVKNYAVAAQNKQIKVHFNPINRTCTAYVDRRIASQILDNVISNAIKYSPQNSNVFIRLYSILDTTIRCEVQDQGAGLSPEDLSKLFGKFTRLTPRPTGGEHSTGLGLFIVKKLVDAMNGKVWCESELGKGTTFFIEFNQAQTVSTPELPPA